MDTLTIDGTVGRDAEIRQTQGGDKVAGFSVAVDRGKDRNGEKITIWYDCSLWGKRADALGPYVTKGTRVAITGRPGARQHEGKIYMQCSVDQITLLGGGSQREERQQPDNYQAPEPSGFGDSEIPF